MSLSILTEDQIRNKFEYRWPRLCLDQRFWELEQVSPVNPVDDWREVKFNYDNFNALDMLDGQQGIYMFIAKPEAVLTDYHSYIVYVGETSNLKNRFRSYFRYRSSKHPSDQKKRRMILVWEDCLYFNYIQTNFESTQLRRELEYDLIDKIAPPINDDFRSEILSAYKKALAF